MDRKILDLPMLWNDLKGVASRWRELGIQLDLDDGELNAISADDSGVAACMRRVLNEWMAAETDDGERKRQIVAALSSPCLGETRLARQLDRDLHLPLKKKDLLNRLSEVSAKWHELGIQLSIHPDRLRQFEARRHDVKQYLSDTLALWLETDNNPTVQDLMDALRSHTVAERRLARELEKKYQGYTVQKRTDE